MVDPYRRRDLESNFKYGLNGSDDLPKPDESWELIATTYIDLSRGEIIVVRVDSLRKADGLEKKAETFDRARRIPGVNV